MTFESVLGKATEPTGCGVLVVRDGRILTGTRKEKASRGQLCGSGGHIESGESPKEAAKREAFEEFGIICDDLKPLGVQDGGRYGRSAVFMCNRFRGTPKTDEEEMTDPKWLTISEIKRKDVFLPFKQSLELLPRERVLKFNPYHSPADGKFTSGPGGGTGEVSLPKGIGEITKDDKELFSGLSWDQFYDDDDKVDRSIDLYDDPDLIEAKWYYTNLSESAKGTHEITMKEANDIVGDNTKASWSQMWFREADSTIKPKIENAIITNPEFRNAALNVAYENYKQFTRAEGKGNTVQKFDEWLTTPITIYRGEQKGQKHIEEDVFLSYSYDRKVAASFGDVVTERTIRPIDTLGGMKLNGEYEVMVPNREFNIPVGKSITGGEDMSKDFTIFKADDEKHLVFGWASISVTIDGEELEDRQHDIIEPEDLEEAAYEYVLNFRDTGEEHIDTMRKKGRLVESCVFTKEKQRAIGIPDGSIPVGWWVGFKIDDDAAWERVKSGMYKMFSIEGRANRKPIEKGKRSYDEYPEYEMWLEENLDATIDEQKAAKEYYFTQKKEAKTVAKTFDDILKFNPFHDHLGRFANKMGFKTYSANPKTKAGAMAISRSAQAGYRGTMNVHSESKGEDIGQNYRWLETGKKPDFVKPTTTKPQKPSKPEKPTQPKQDPDSKQPKSISELSESVADVNLSYVNKIALSARDWNGKEVKTREVAKDHYQDIVTGKDISKTIDVGSTDSPLDVVVKAQGWDKAPTVVNDRDTFDKLCLQSGRVLIRSVHGNRNTGETADDVCKSTMSSKNFALNGTGARAYGSGMYMVDTAINSQKPRDTKQRIEAGQSESYGYGNVQMMATVHPSAKIATESQVRQLRREFRNADMSTFDRFNGDVNSYIASKGYDGAKMHDDSDPTAYTTIFNRSALIFYGGVADR